MPVVASNAVEANDIKTSSIPKQPVSETAIFVLQVGDDDVQPVQLENSFSSFAAFGFCFGVLNTWVVLLTGLGAGLISGGPSTLIWGFVYATICNLALTASLSEAFAVYPTAGGQYHWASILSVPKRRAVISWFTALFNLGGLWAGAATQAYLASTLIVAMAKLNNLEYISTSGESYAIYLAVILFGLGSSLVSAVKFTRMLDSSMAWFSVLGLVTIAVTILAMTTPKAPAAFVFTGVLNFSGWDSTVIAWLIGLLNSSFAFIGFDLVFHISEELPDAKRSGPRVIMATVLVGGMTGMFCLLALLFCVNDVEVILDSAYGLPFAQICMDATHSRAASTIFLLIPMVLLVYGCRGCLLTASRLMLSIGRDSGLPYSALFLRIRSGEPIWGLVVSSIVPALGGLVQIGSSAAFNALLGTAVILLQVSYIVPVILIMAGGRAQLNASDPDRLSNLGRLGLPCNMVACFFVLQSLVIFCFPSSQPVTASSMNYVSAFVGGYTIILIALWNLWGWKRFHGPSVSQITALFADVRGRVVSNAVAEADDC